MDRKQELEMLQKLNEKELTKNFLIPLYESSGMGCKNVRYTHKRLEFGKDIIYYKDDEHGNRVYTGVQVKRIKITTKEIDTIFRQTCEAFGEPFTDLADGGKKDLKRFVVLTSNEFLDEAKDSYWASLRGAKLDKFVTCVDGNQLINLLYEHCPSLLHMVQGYPEKHPNRILEKFREMLGSPSSQEKIFRQLFIENPWLVGVGYKYAKITPEEENGEYSWVDLSLETFEHDYDIMILKSHLDPIILSDEKGWKLSEECGVGLCQVYKYFERYEQMLEKEHYKPKDDVYRPTGFIVIGRNMEKVIQKKLKLVNNHFQRIKILTYDDLHNQAERWVEIKTREGIE